MNTVLFDLDGTLLPIDMKEFIDTYVELMTGFLKSNDLNPDDIVPSIWKATGAMEVNDGLITNEELFWKVLMEDLASKNEMYDEKFKRRFQKLLDKFYKGDFQMIRYMVRPSQSCHDAVMMLKEKGYVEQPYYGDITFTELGYGYAKAVYKRHRYLKTFLSKALGIAEDVAEDEACLMEHAISDDSFEKWVAYIDGLGIIEE